MERCIPRVWVWLGRVKMGGRPVFSWKRIVINGLKKSVKGIFYAILVIFMLGLAGTSLHKKRRRKRIV